ncbi:MAG: NUDIX hydrolase [Pseudonocardiaceae bacterium]
MRDAELVSTEVLLAKPKRFICEMLRMPDGREIDWYYSDVPESVMVVPVTTSGSLVLVKQYRHNLKSDTLELPAGVAKKDEPLEIAALRELTEETGYVLSRDAALEPLGRFYALPSETNKWVNFFLARPVIANGPAAGDTEIEKYFDMSIVEMPLDRVLNAVGRTIHGIETAGALMLACQRLQGIDQVGV